MNEYSEIRKSIRRICRIDDAARHPLLLVAEVVEVNAAARTCIVAPSGTGQAVVKLRAPSAGGSDQFLFPLRGNLSGDDISFLLYFCRVKIAGRCRDAIYRVSRTR
jgi:hypothetical protein